MIFSPKQKLFQIPLATVKQIKKYFVQQKNFWVVLGVLKFGVFGIFCYIWDHTNAIKTKKNVIFFIHETNHS